VRRHRLIVHEPRRGARACATMPAVPRSIRLLAAICLAGALALLVAAAPGSAATSLKRCNIRGKEQRLGATYVTSLRVRAVSCATGERVEKAFQSCRRAKGVRGRCTRRVLRFSCSETRPSDEQIPTQLNGHVTCRRGTRRVAFVYQQDT
jgi:hypothetical protein